MGLKISLDVQLSGVYAKSERVAGAVRNAPAGIVYPSGQQNVYKARASFDRGDTTYKLPPEYKQRAQKVLVTEIKLVFDGRRSDLRKGMERAVRIVRDGVKENIKVGGVEGPERSPRWIARKGHNVNMVGLTGRFVNSLRAKAE